MDVNFDEPLLDSIKCEVKGKTFTLYEYCADAYYEHIFTEDAAKAYEESLKGDNNPLTNDEAKDPTPAEVVRTFRELKDVKALHVALALYPGEGFRDKKVEDIADWVKRCISPVDLTALYMKAKEVNGVSNDAPKPTAGQTAPLSDDSPENTASPS